MRKLFAMLVVLAVGVVTGCSDSPTEPGGQAIVGTWKSGKVGNAFGGGNNLTVVFNDNGSFSVDSDVMDLTGTYTTSGSSASSTIRTITMTSPFMNFKGIYEISGNQMKLEVVTDPVPNGMTAPEVALGIGSTTVNGNKTNDFVNEVQKQ